MQKNVDSQKMHMALQWIVFLRYQCEGSLNIALHRDLQQCDRADCRVHHLLHMLMATESIGSEGIKGLRTL